MLIHDHINFWALFNIFALHIGKSAFLSCGIIVPFKFLLSLSIIRLTYLKTLWSSIFAEAVNFLFLASKEYPEGKKPLQ